MRFNGMFCLFSLSLSPLSSDGWLSLCRYAYRFLEEVVPIVDTEQMEELHEMVEDQAAQWKRDTLKRIRDTEHSMDQGDDQLYYEVVQS